MTDTTYLFALTIILLIALLKWNYDSSRLARYQKAQIKLLAQIAAAHGISKDKVAEIVALARMESGDEKLIAEAMKNK